MKYLDRLHGSGKSHKVVSAIEYGAASYGFGYLMSRYRERASVYGVQADLLAGVLLKGVSLFGGRYVRGGVGTLVDNVSNAGIGAFFHTLGAGHGGEHAGVTRLVLDKKDVPRAKAALPNATVLGDIPRAPHGDFLSASELAALAR